MTASITVVDILLKLLVIVPSAAALFAIAMVVRRLRFKVLGKLRYTRDFSAEEVYEGETVYITETVYNPTLFPLPFLRIASFIDGRLEIVGTERDPEGMQTVVSRFNLLPFAKTTRKYPVICSRRGLYTMTSAAVVHRNGEIDYVNSFRIDAKLYVLPALAASALPGKAINFREGDFASLNRYIKDPFSASGVRDLVPGDPFRLINFKATARSVGVGTGRIKVNRLDPSSERTLMIMIDFEEPKDDDKRRTHDEKMERALSAASYFVSLSANRGVSVGVGANCESEDGERFVYRPISSGRASALLTLRALAAAKTRHASSLASLALEGLRRGLAADEVVILTDAPEGEAQDAARLLRTRCSAEVIAL